MRTIDRRISALERVADPTAGTPLILFGDDPQTRTARTVIRFDEEDRNL